MSKIWPNEGMGKEHFRNGKSVKALVERGLVHGKVQLKISVGVGELPKERSGRARLY